MCDRYANGKIYAIRSYMTDDIYIGSTCLTLCQRMYKHRYNYKCHQSDTSPYMTSFEIIKHDDHYIELIEAFPCGSKAELLRKEGEFIRSVPCVNKQIAGRTKEEWIEENKDIVKNNKKEIQRHSKRTNRKIQ